MTWQEVDQLDRNIVVVIPTGSLEQHGPHLPLFTDTNLVTAAALSVESRIPTKMLLTPTLWLGASGHHLKFPGTLSASFDAYNGAIESVVESLIPHGFRKFFVLNGHGGNTEPNGVVMRKLKAAHLDLTFGHASYYEFGAQEAARVMEGPLKEIRHSCEAEVSLAMHLFGDQVRRDKLRDDGLSSEPPIKGVIHHFDEMTQEGSYGFATLGTKEKGEAIFNAAVNGVTQNIEALADGYVLLQSF